MYRNGYKEYLQEAIRKKDIEKAEKLINNLIEDTQKDIED